MHKLHSCVSPHSYMNCALNVQVSMIQAGRGLVMVLVGAMCRSRCSVEQSMGIFATSRLVANTMYII